VAPGSVIAVAAGTLTEAFARRLTDVADLTVVTNSLAVSTILAREGRADRRTVLTGGVREASGALVGPLAEAGARFHPVRQAFAGTCGMSRQRGFTAASIGAAAVSRAMLAVADIRVVLAEHTRWNATGVAVFAELSDADVLITDSGLPIDALHVLEGEINAVIVA
jgi:DeoR/GlpR family transcriptional regulator of sugar metabolism